MILNIKVKPNSKKSEVIEEGGTLQIKLKSPPENNEANIELINLLGKHFKVNSKDIMIIRGKKSRNKTIKIKDEV